LNSNDFEVGDWVVGQSGTVCLVANVGDCLILLTPDGRRLRVVSDAIKRKGLPATPSRPGYLPGQWVDVWFPDYQMWVGGYQFVNSGDDGRGWLVKGGVEGTSRLGWVRPSDETPDQENERLFLERVCNPTMFAWQVLAVPNLITQQREQYPSQFIGSEFKVLWLPSESAQNAASKAGLSVDLVCNPLIGLDDKPDFW
jgi:hypothetical protein